MPPLVPNRSDTALIRWQRAEGAILFAVAIWIYSGGDAPFALWLAVIVFFLPDVSFLGYVLGPKPGAMAYNAVHVYAFGAVVWVFGTAIESPLWAGCGLLWLAHSGFDRALGYGLKSTAGFQDTHLGRIGRG
jgi:hypothetical protein